MPECFLLLVRRSTHLPVVTVQSVAFLYFFISAHSAPSVLCCIFPSQVKNPMNKQLSMSVRAGRHLPSVHFVMLCLPSPSNCWLFGVDIHLLVHLCTSHNGLLPAVGSHFILRPDEPHCSFPRWERRRRFFFLQVSHCCFLVPNFEWLSFTNRSNAAALWIQSSKHV